MPVIGFLNSASANLFEHLVQAFRDVLGVAGYVEGRNVTIEKLEFRVPRRILERWMMILTASKGSTPLCSAGLGRAVVIDRLPLQQSRLRQGSRMLKQSLPFGKNRLHCALPVLITNQHGHVPVRRPNAQPRSCGVVVVCSKLLTRRGMWMRPARDQEALSERRTEIASHAC